MLNTIEMSMKTDSTIRGNNGVVVAGIMSGTSLDGVDIALCSFEEHKGNWHYEILAAKTVKYNDFWRKTLRNAHLLKGEDLVCLDRNFGDYLGDLVYNFISRKRIKPQLISSHGHTVFHKPDKGFTFQIGHGTNIAVRTGIAVVSDFRSKDIARGGQGAPLVPVGDKLLFANYDSCLNLGGFANISFDLKGKRIAFDICPVNIILNELAQKCGHDCDKNGLIGERGKINKDLLEKMNHIEYYRKAPPKSLSREWMESEFSVNLSINKIKTEDKLATVYAHIAHQILQVIDNYAIRNILVTGGGVFNKFLLNLLKSESKAEIIVPDKLIIKYKEALIFGCLGLLRLNNQINCLSSVTGAKSDSVCGVLHMP